jgi:CarD family transcriptional regulator
MAARKNTKNTTSKASKPAVKKTKPKSKPTRAKSAAKGSVVRSPAAAKATKAGSVKTAAKGMVASKAAVAAKGAAAKATASKTMVSKLTVNKSTASRNTVSKTTSGKTTSGKTTANKPTVAKTKAAPAAKGKVEANRGRTKPATRVAAKASQPASAKAPMAAEAHAPVKAATLAAPTRAQPLAPQAAAMAAKEVTGPEAAVATNIAGTAPATVPPPATAQKPAVPKTALAPAKPEKNEQNGEQRTMKTSGNRNGFKLNEFVVYPAHGVGQIVSIEEQEVAGFKLELFVINFVKDKMTLRVPTAKVTGVGMRKLSDMDAARRSLEILTGRARVKRTMWSRRAQEYESKINSGDINAIAEVVRDLYRSDAQPEQSYSERQLYEAALDRMMREIAAVHRLTETEALKMIETQLKKNVKRAPKADAPEGEAEAESEEADIEEAA